MKNIFDVLEFEEGRRLSPYKDHLGFWTVGVGRCFEKRPFNQRERDYLGIKPGIGDLEWLQDNPLSDAQCDWLLAGDIAATTEQIERIAALADVYFWLDEARATALLSMCYQMGCTEISGWDGTLSALKDERWHDAELHALDSKWHRKDTPARAKRTARVFRTGTLEGYADA